VLEALGRAAICRDVTPEQLAVALAG
jgi:hypothetical protein